MLSKSMKKIISNRHFHQAIDKTLKIPEKILAGLVSSSLTLSVHNEKRFSFFVCVHVEVLPK